VAWPVDQGFDLAGHYLWRAQDGMVLPIHDRATPIRDGAGTLLGAVWVFRDATANQQLVAHLQAVLREQELQLREACHRIKNNFQTIASLLARKPTPWKTLAPLRHLRTASSGSDPWPSSIKACMNPGTWTG
jgi:hypothetical protein